MRRSASVLLAVLLIGGCARHDYNPSPARSAATWPASYLHLRDVYAPDGIRLGRVNDLVLSPEGRLTAIVVRRPARLDDSPTFIRLAVSDMRSGGRGGQAILMVRDGVDWDDLPAASLRDDEWLVSDVAGKPVQLRGVRIGQIDDLLIGGGGRVVAYIYDAAAAGAGDRRYLEPPRRIDEIAQGLALDFTPQELSTRRLDRNMLAPDPFAGED